MSCGIGSESGTPSPVVSEFPYTIEQHQFYLSAKRFINLYESTRNLSKVEDGQLSPDGAARIVRSKALPMAAGELFNLAVCKRSPSKCQDARKDAGAASLRHIFGVSVEKQSL